MKILASSDFHGNLPIIDTEFDLFLICGDICPAHDHYCSFQIDWIEGEFCNWINSLPFKTPYSKVVMTWGNHDFIGEKITKDELDEISRLTNDRLVILNFSYYDYEYPVSDGTDILRIFGSPYCSLFGRWAFMYSDEELDKRYSKIPTDLNIDILISHDSPSFNKMGAITEGFYKSDETGNKVLMNHVKRIHPLVFHTGHFHSGNHEFVNIDGIWMSNVSYIDESYSPAYPVLEYEIDDETKKVIKL